MILNLDKIFLCGPTLVFNTLLFSTFSIDGSILNLLFHVQNAWMASSPGHPFWIFFAKLIQTIHEKKPSEQYIEPEQATGPMILKQALDAWRSLRDDSSIKVIKAGTLTRPGIPLFERDKRLYSTSA